MTTYCTKAEIERFLSVQGVVNMADHDEDGIVEAGVIDDAIAEAKGEIDLFCRGRYSEAGLASSTLVNNWAVTIAASALCELRGNTVPDSLNRRVTRIIETLLPKIQTGELNLPGLAFANDSRPAMSNLTVDRRYARSKVRVTQINSTNQTRKVATNYADEPIPNG